MIADYYGELTLLNFAVNLSKEDTSEKAPTSFLNIDSTKKKKKNLRISLGREEKKDESQDNELWGSRTSFVSSYLQLPIARITNHPFAFNGLK